MKLARPFKAGIEQPNVCASRSDPMRPKHLPFSLVATRRRLLDASYPALKGRAKLMRRYAATTHRY